MSSLLQRAFGMMGHRKAVLSEANQVGAVGEVGIGVVVEGNISIEFPERVVLGSYIYIGPGTQLYGRGGLHIHDHVIIAPEVVIMTSMHNFRQAAMVPYDEIELLSPVVVERCAWIGMRAIIMPGVRIGEGSIVGAGAVVTKGLPPGSIVAGNPAREVGRRDMDHFSACVERGEFYLRRKLELGLTKREVFK